MQHTSLTLPGNIIIAAATQGGKTFLMQRLMHEELLSQVDVLVLMSLTMDLSGDFSDWQEQRDPDRGLVVYRFTRGDQFIPALRDLVDSAEGLMKHHKKSAVPKTLVVLDDLVGHEMLRFRGYLDQLSTRSRHLGISIAILTQRLSAVPRTFRLNAKYAILLSPANYTDLEAFLDQCTPRKYHKQLRRHITRIFDEPYAFILCNCFAKNHRDRMWLNRERRLIDVIDEYDGNPGMQPASHP